MSALPAHPDQFAPDWLAEKLGRAAGRLKGLTYEEIGTGQGGDSYRLFLDWANPDDGPASIVSKCPSALEKNLAMAKMLNIYEVEVRWYQTFASQINVRAPICYYAELGDNIENFVLLLEDLAPAKQGDQLAGASVETIAQMLREAAPLHAYKWNDPVLKNYPWLHYLEAMQQMARNSLPDVYPQFRELFTGRLDEALLDMGAELARRYESLAERQTAWALYHGDFRLDNTMFSDKDGRAVILDWQTVGMGTPLSDVAYCIGTGIADPKIRKQHEKALVADYYKQLRQLGVAGYDEEMCWRDYRVGAFHGFLAVIFGSVFVERDQRGDEMFAVMAERSGWQALHLDSLALLHR